MRAKRLDVGGMDFELEVHDATTNQQYVDESMLLPRGTRLIVRRVGAGRGQGIVARMQRAESGMTVAPVARPNAPSGFYTIESHDRDDEGDYVPTNSGARDDEKELADLMAVTEASQNPLAGARSVVGSTGYRPAGSGPPPHAGGRGNFQKQPNFRPNADPELRAQEQQQMPKKRATGIPRTFLNLSAPPVTDGTKPGEEGMENVPRLQPNALGFEELVNRGGGQAENAAGTKRDLDYALKLTATTIPEHLQCAICHGVVKNAMLLPWDSEGRTTCETCIRDALAQSGFVCPLTGMEGVSPDDLLPNQPLRKAADFFIKGVMEKMDEIDKQQVDEPDEENIATGQASLFEGDAGDKGMIVSKKTMKDHRSKRLDEDDPFGGGEDDFGGDVFDVKAEDDEADGDLAKDEEAPKAADFEKKELIAPNKDNAANEDNQKTNEDAAKASGVTATPEKPTENSSKDDHQSESMHGSPDEKHRRDARKPRGPPAGYAMGPAGGAAVRGGSGYPGGGRGDRGGHGDHRGEHGRGGRGWNYRERGRGRYNGGGRYGDYRGGRGHHYNSGRQGDNEEWSQSHEVSPIICCAAPG